MIEKHEIDRKQSPQKSVIKYKKNSVNVENSIHQIRLLQRKQRNARKIKTNDHQSYGFDKQASQASLFKELEQSVLLTPNPVLNALNLNFSSKDDGNDYLNTTN